EYIERNKAATPQVEALCKVTFEDVVTVRDGTLTLQDRVFSMLPPTQFKRGDRVRVTLEKLAVEAPKPLTCNCGEVATEHCNVHGDHLKASKPVREMSPWEYANRGAA